MSKEGVFRGRTLASVCSIPRNRIILEVNDDLWLISLTSSLCKVAEEIVISYGLKPSIISYLDSNHYDCIPQWPCTALALISLIHCWRETLDARGGTIRGLLMEYQKACDLIEHNILCQKSQRIATKQSIFNWIADFLDALSQRVKPHSSCCQLFVELFSDWKPINLGVPHGTRLSPWLFLLMINDLSIPFDDCEGDMFEYADDVSEYISNHSIQVPFPDFTNCILNRSTDGPMALTLTFESTTQRKH